MIQAFRVFFSIVWFISLGVSFATGLGFIVTLGGYGEYLLWSLITLAASTGLVSALSALE